MINSCLGKVFNTIINNRLVKCLCDNNKICNEQIGFKKKAWTSDHLFVMNVLLQKYTKCFVDIKKAYDSVWRRSLMLKILKTGIQGNMFKLIENMYSGGGGGLSSIKIDGHLSKNFECDTGVRQGDVLSPNLFNVFVNDLPTKTQYTPVINKRPVSCLMYADDLVIMSLSIDDLQVQVNNLNEYCIEWGLDDQTKNSLTAWLPQYLKTTTKYGEALCTCLHST